MATVHTEMSGEHKQWQSDNCMWRDDLARWQKQAEQAIAALKSLEESLQKHRKALQLHQLAIATEEQELKVHEHAMAEFERGGAGENLLEMVGPHKEGASKHNARKEAHARLKKHHHAVMASWSALEQALSEKV